MSIIQAHKISCQRGHYQLFKSISFDLAYGDSLLISGINGIGKTTLLESLAGLRSVSLGHISYLNNKLSQTRDQWFENSFFIGHKSGHKKELSCLENLCSYLRIQGININHNQAEIALEKVGLAGYEYQAAGLMSAGQKKRLSLARLTLINHSIWILDEPFVNLDKAGCEWLLNLLSKHLKSKGIVIITAHDNNAIAQTVSKEITLEALE